ncbi:MAG: Rpn family recombination-promoting nuclease/putative transposase [Magnetococcales bacterium]|nr:Rpn family recombination-promoting nuclease/putative transposase [Magnetococcales bacterium]
MEDLYQPHDKFIKVLLGQPETATIFFQERLPGPLVERLRLDKVESVEGTFLDEHLRGHFSDRLFRVATLQEEEAYVYSLMEHKSWYDPWEPLQLLTNMVHLFNWLKQGSRRKLPLVVGILIHHGASPWKGENQFSPLVNANGDLAPYVVDFRFVLVDLGPIPDQEISKDSRLRSGLLALKYAFRTEEQRRILFEIAKDLVDLPREYVLQILRYLIQVYDALDEPIIHEVVHKARGKEADEMASIFAREMIAKGVQQGIQLGVQQGVQQGEARVLLRRLAKLSGGVVPLWVQEKVNGADLATLERWNDLVDDARTLEDVFGPSLH